MLNHPSEFFAAECDHCQWSTNAPEDASEAFRVAREHDRANHEGTRTARAIVPVPPDRSNDDQ